MSLKVSGNSPSSVNLFTPAVSTQAAPAKVAATSAGTQRLNLFERDTFTPAVRPAFNPVTSGDVDGVRAARELLPRLESAINTTGSLLDRQPGLAMPIARKTLGELYTPDAKVFPGLASSPGGNGLAGLLQGMHSNDAQLHVGGADGKSGVSDVYGLPDSTDDKGGFVMISRGTRGDVPYTTAEQFKYERTPQGLRITEHVLLENFNSNEPSSNPELRKHLQAPGTAQ